MEAQRHYSFSKTIRLDWASNRKMVEVDESPRKAIHSSQILWKQLEMCVLLLFIWFWTYLFVGQRMVVEYGQLLGELPTSECPWWCLVVLHVVSVLLLLTGCLSILWCKEKRLLANVPSPYLHYLFTILLLDLQFDQDWNSSTLGAWLCRCIPWGG